MNEEVYNLIKDNERLIYKIAKQYSTYSDIDDLYQVGCIGIMKAYKKFNPNMGTKFSTYAYTFILGEIVEFIRKDRNIIVSDEIYSIYKKYIKIKELLSSKNGIDPSFSEICSYMGIEENNLLHIIESVSFTKSINTDIECYDDNREELLNKILIDQELELLDEKDKLLITYRYYKGFTQSETASLLGATQVKVSRQEKLILGRIRENLKA